MKHSIWIFIASIFVFSSCKEDTQIRKTTCIKQGDYDYLDYSNSGTMCSSDLCAEYFEIWKELIKDKNNLSQDFIDSHFILCNSKINSWANGISFNICYKVKFDWAIAYNCDQFIIKINAENTYYPSLNLPRGTYLTKDEIKIAVDNRAFASDIAKVINKSALKYTNMESALNELIDFSDVNTLCMSRIFLDNNTGHLILEASAEYENEKNSCIRGIIDLMSGDKNVNDIPCWIN